MAIIDRTRRSRKFLARLQCRLRPFKRRQSMGAFGQKRTFDAGLTERQRDS
jgi:hypothetical protein